MSTAGKRWLIVLALVLRAKWASGQNFEPGYISIPQQASAPSTPCCGVFLYADSSARIAWKSLLGFAATISSASLSADRLYTLPDVAGTLLLTTSPTPGTAGKVLVSDGAAWITSTPTFPNASATSGKTIRSDGTNWIASTATLSDTPSTAGKVLVSDGTNWIASTPTFPNASATALKHIRSDGTNWIASTATISDTPSTALKWLRSDGTNWITSTSTLSDSPSTAGKIPVSDGTNWITSTPTFPNASATSGKFIRSDGTNWVASTSTIPNTFTKGDMLAATTNALTAVAVGTDGQVMTADAASTPGVKWAAGPTHNLLSATHSDTVAASAVRGGTIVANSTPAWAQVAVGAANSIWWSNGTDPSWTTAPSIGGNTSIAGSLTLTGASGNLIANGSGTYLRNADSSRGLLQSYDGSAYRQQQFDAASFAFYIAGAQKGPATDVNGHEGHKGTAPSMGTCGSVPSPSVSGNDNEGVITVGGGVVTSCALNFAATWGTAPICVVSDNSTTVPASVSSISTTVLTVATSTSIGGGKIYYVCREPL